MKIDINQLDFINRNLRDILLFVESEAGVEVTVTSLFRIGDKGVHGTLPLRGTDIRVRNRTVGEALQEMINNSWVYDRERPYLNCAVLHGDDSDLHLHIQVHQNTVLR